MSNEAALLSGKGQNDENFPVASFLIDRRYRPRILAFYNFARTADDIADHPSANPDEKLRLLAAMEATLLGRASESPQALALRRVLGESGLSSQHAFDLLEAFRRDVTKTRYDDWNALMDYCRYSAMPVGRFVLDVHGESQSLWPMNDALCAALQVINHLQDCGKDYRDLNRVYIPLDSLGREGLTVEALAERRAPPGLRSVIIELAARTEALLRISKPFAADVGNFRLGLEVGVIQGLAERLVARLSRRDPLCESVHHGKAETLAIALGAASGFTLARFAPRRAAIRAVS